MTGILLAFIGIGIIVLWRSGALGRALRIAPPARMGAPSVIATITHTAFPTVADKLPTASFAALAQSPQGPGSVVSTAGNFDNGFSSTYIGSPSWVAWRDSERSLLIRPTGAAVLVGGGGGGAELSPE